MTDSTDKPGSQSALRHQNQQRVIDALFAGGPATQAELARGTGLSAATISNLVRALSESGRVEAVPTTSSGRRALSVRLVDDGTHAVGIDFGRSHLRIVVATPAYAVVAERFTTLEPGWGAAEGVALASGILGQMLEENAIPPASVLGAGVGIPGPIDRRSGRVVQGSILPEWVGVDLSSVEEHLHFPVFFDNDANLGAIAELTWGAQRSVTDLVFVKVGSGIGSGIVLGGSLHYGHLGVTGEIGHQTIDEQGAVCHCGNRGCLETIASTARMIDLLSRPNTDPITTEDILTNARAGDSATLRVLDDAGMALGRALAGIANLINPEVVVVGGPLAPLGDLFLNSVHRGLARHALPVVSETTAVVMSSLGDRAEALGAASLVLGRSRGGRG